ncbi:MAG: AAA family ATPase [Nitrococcus mobilis]|nr:AAA family ATPase [Nitrococcus mobilis]
MVIPKPLNPEELYRRCDPKTFDFETTAELEPFNEIVGQNRVLETLRFGTGINSEGYNLFVLGPPGIGKHEVVEKFLHARAADEPTPSDWVYINNFTNPHKPRLIELSAGRGERFREELEQLVQELRSAIPATFESEEYQSRLHDLQQEFGQRQQEAFREIQEEADKHDIALTQTQSGFTFAPRRNGEVLRLESYRALPEEERQEFERTIEQLQERLQQVIQQMPRWRKETQNRINELNEEMALFAVGHLLDEFRANYQDCPRILEHLDAIQKDVIENVGAFISQDNHNRAAEQLLNRYLANVLIDNAQQQGAPVVYDDMPTHQHLIGRIEHHVQQGALLTDFRLIRPGVLHQANGGYLILDVRKLLMQPFAWESLKRALYSNQIKTESLEQLYSLMSTVSLEPEPVPLNLKVVLLGERLLYYLLSAFDPDFLELFKVQADFEEDVARTVESTQHYARLIGTMARQENLLALDTSGVARVIEHGSRLADDSERLTTHNRAIFDLLREAHYWASSAGSDRISSQHVQQAIDHQIYRASRVRESIERAIHRGTIMIDTAGKAVGRVNGLSIIQLGGYAFGRPTRITATARLGRGNMVDIEREAKLGGNIHSKGVMILSNFLASRYARDRPLSLSASLAFEQSYGMVDGDSASVAEFCALISVLADTPLKQSLAVTGSVNQHGQIQAVGGVNEKIEGFFDICKKQHLDGTHGVLLPAANIPHLMLRHDVVEAVRDGRFHVYPVSTVDEALALLTGMEAGERGSDGQYPADSVNHRVEQRLRELAELARRVHGGNDERVEQRKDNGDE